ncbi:MAG TPA: hypothetical protein VGY97_04990 [Solirubrobacteraceae bacterium]|nr:hypothetical protein [Solirubrobacteraceae bacterium]
MLAPSPRLWRATLVALGALAVGAPALGGGLSALPIASAGAAPAPSGTATAQPNTAGQPSKIVINASGSAGGVGQSVPSGVTVAVYRGFQLDLATVAQPCTSEQAANFTCPPASQVASGTFSGTYSYATAQGSFNGTIEAFQGPAETGNLADVFVEVDVAGGKYGAKGQLVAVNDPTYGYEIRFDPLPTASLPPGFTATVNQLTVTVGASRTVTPPPAPSPTKPARRHRRHRCRGRRHCRKHRQRTGRSAATTHSLITNPATCAGSWPLQLRLRYSDHTDVRDAAIACST